MRFLHAADLHLGYRQYNLEARLEDFERGFVSVAKAALGESGRDGEPVDLLLIAGDLFHDRTINARTFTQATAVLSKLREAGVPVYVIEGNHDRAFHTDGMSWLEALDHRGLIELIRLKEDQDAGLSHLGDYRELEVDGDLVRIYGVKYVGSTTPALAEDLAEEVATVEGREPADLSVAMMHFGIEGQADAPGYSYNKVRPLREHVDYLALGHFHNAYSLEDWLYNPGSVEATSVVEAGEPRGVYLYDDGETELLDLGGRRFERVFVDVSAAATPEEAYGLVRDRAPEEDGAVVDVVLTGELRFDRSTISREAVENAMGGDPLHVTLKVEATRDEVDVETGELESRAAIERRVFDTLAADGDIPDEAAPVLTHVKDLALQRAGTDEILDAVSTLLDDEETGAGEPDRERDLDTSEETGDGSAETRPGEEPETRDGDAGAETESPDDGEGEEWNWRTAGAD